MMHNLEDVSRRFIRECICRSNLLLAEYRLDYIAGAVVSVHVVTAMVKISALGERDDNENVPPFVAESLSRLNKAVRVPFALNDAKPQNVKPGL